MKGLHEKQCQTANRIDYTFQIIVIDHWGPVLRSRTENAYLLIVVDMVSKYVFFHPSKDTSSEIVVKFLGEHLNFGTRQKLISDNLRPLIGRNMIELMK